MATVTLVAAGIARFAGGEFVAGEEVALVRGPPEERVLVGMGVVVARRDGLVVRADRGVRPQPGDELRAPATAAEGAPRAGAWPTAPERLSGVEVGLEAGALLRGDRPGTTGRVWIEDQLAAPVALWVRAEPIGATSGPGADEPYTPGFAFGWYAAAAGGGLDTRYGAIGAELGLSKRTVDTDDHDSTAPAAGLRGRLGARDGLHLCADLGWMAWAEAPEAPERSWAHRNTVPANAGVELVVPLSQRYDVGARYAWADAAGHLGDAWFELPLVGNSDRGSVRMRLGVGGAQLHGHPQGVYTTGGGVLVTSAVRWRL